MPTTRTVEINFSPRAWDELTNLAQRTHRTPSQVISDGLGLLKWIDQAQLDGYRILQETNGQARQVIFP